MADRAHVPVREFRELGYLQEVNRRLLHPLGLAIEVGQVEEPTVRLTLTAEGADALRLLIDRVRAADPTALDAMRELEARLDDAERYEVGDEVLGGIWDERADPEGITFDHVDPEKAARVTDELNLRALGRMAKLGWIIQPVEP